MPPLSPPGSAGPIAPVLPSAGRSRPNAGAGVAAVAALAVSWPVAGLMRWGPDWSAQEFRAWTAAHHGLSVWTNSWYSGLALPGYSVLYPVVAGVVGAGATGVLAVVAAVAAAHGFAPQDSRVRAVGFTVSSIFVLLTDLVIGQVPYLLGVAVGVWTLRAVRAAVAWPVVVLLAAATSLASPLAGLFLLLVAPAVASAVGVVRAMPLAGAVAGVAVAAVFGGAGGTFPYLTLSIWWTAILVAVGLLLTTRGQRPYRVLALTVLVALVVDLAVPNPVGGNLVRLGQLVSMPLVWVLLPGLRLPPPRVVVAAVMVGAGGLWPAYPAVTSMMNGATQPSQHASFYRGLLHFLATQDPRKGRLEAVFTRQHWETYFVATRYPIARGWEQQADEADNQVLYHPLTPAIYRRWLDANAVDLVALPREPLDAHAGTYEGALLAHPPGYLVPVWHDRDWRVWRVRDPRPLAGRPARLTSLGPASFRLDFAHPGTSDVRIHESRLWTVTSGRACLTSTADGFLRVTSTRAGTVTVRARVGLHDLIGRGGSAC